MYNFLDESNTYYMAFDRSSGDDQRFAELDFTAYTIQSAIERNRRQRDGAGEGESQN